MAVARYMLQGCDVWLNTPLRPLEASGTSGMKAQANGVLNLSILDGWWDEAWQLGLDQEVDVGWAIGSGESYQDPAYQDQVEAEALYESLEHEIVPAFYERRADGLPLKWVARMKTSISKLCPEFNMHRMVTQYINEYYVAADHRYRSFSNENEVRTRQFSAWLQRVQAAWPLVEVESVCESVCEVSLQNRLELSAQINLNTLTPEDIAVEVVTGRVDADGEIRNARVTAMEPAGKDTSGKYRFHCCVQPMGSGMYGYAVRVLPRNSDSVSPFIPGLISWANCRPVSGDLSQEKLLQRTANV